MLDNTRLIVNLDSNEVRQLYIRVVHCLLGIQLTTTLFNSQSEAKM